MFMLGSHLNFSNRSLANRLIITLFIAFMAICISQSSVYAQTISVLHYFNGSQPSPYGSLIQANDGNLYGTATCGGSASKGAILQYNTTTGKWNVVHSFSDGSVINDGNSPDTSLIQAKDGNLYGTTTHGGTTGVGTIYKYDVTNGVVTILHSFNTNSEIGDGYYPCSALTEAKDGNLYGTTWSGGTAGFGTIYKYVITSGVVTILHNFNDGSVTSDGAFPYASLIQTKDGNLYGTTENGGTAGFGTIYKYDITSGVVTILHNFNDGSVTSDGYYPNSAALIQGSDGNLYGTNFYGGTAGFGTIYKYDVTNRVVTILHSFNDGSVTSDGYNPCSALTEAKDGNLYGTTYNGGTAGAGTIYKYNVTTGILTILHSFNDGSVTFDGTYPYSALIQATDGNLYGTTINGGRTGNGAIYKYDTISGSTSILTDFLDGKNPYAASFIQATDGNLYGTTLSGGSASSGSIVKYNPQTGDITVVHSFSDGSVNGDGDNPWSALIQGSDGNLYGTTINGGTTGAGTIYKYNVTTGAVTILHSFNDVSVAGDGKSPYSALIQATDGNLYGTTYNGGTAGAGTIYKYNVATGAVTILHNFNDGSVTGDGIYPSTLLIQAKDGNLYSTTMYGGTAGAGTIYKYNVTSGVVTILHSFSDCSVTGSYPYSALIQAKDGNLYGTTIYGGETASSVGIAGYGTIYKYNVTTGVVTILHSFNDGSVTSDGFYPYSALTQAKDGSFYGTTSWGGTAGAGTVYQFFPFSNKLTILHSFGDGSVINDGYYPSYAALMQANDGSIYGTTIYSNCLGTGGGVLYRLNTSQTVLKSSLNPSIAGQSVTFTATITGNSPIGEIQFSIDGVNAGSAVPLVSGVATYTTSGLSIGSHTVTADYRGDANNIGSTSNALTQVVIPVPPPTITSLSPSTVSGAKTFTLTVNGTNFVSGSIIKWNGTNMVTTYVSPTQLTTSINKYYTTLASYPGTAKVSVLNPDGGRSTGSTITITQPVAPPAISSLSPSSVTGATTFTLTVNGSNFVNGSIIKWNGTNMTTTFVSSTQLTASINKYYDTLASYPGSATVSVLNPDGGRSTGATIAITQPITPPAITSLSPSNVTGATTFTLTVNGTGFQSGAVIKWNGTNMTTTFVSSTQVTAVINKYYTTLASYPGSATVSVLNPDSGRSAGAALAITQP